MYAIFRAGGHQIKAQVGDTVRIDRLAQDVGNEVKFADVLMVGGDSVKLGSPTVDGVTVVGKVRGHEKGEKVIAYKYEQRNHARRKRGFRHSYTDVEITAIEGA